MSDHNPALRNLARVLRKAESARDGIDKTRARLRATKRTPEWLLEELDLAIDRLVPVIGELTYQLEQKK